MTSLILYYEPFNGNVCEVKPQLSAAICKKSPLPIKQMKIPWTVQELLFYKSGFIPPILVAARSNEWACELRLSGITGSNSANGMDVFLLWLTCVVR
jgi:hypothetical protein